MLSPNSTLFHVLQSCRVVRSLEFHKIKQLFECQLHTTNSVNAQLTLDLTVGGALSICLARTHFLLLKRSFPAMSRTIYAAWASQLGKLNGSCIPRTFGKELTLNSALFIVMANGCPCSLLASITQQPNGIAPCNIP